MIVNPRELMSKHISIYNDFTHNTHACIHFTRNFKGVAKIHPIQSIHTETCLLRIFVKRSFYNLFVNSGCISLLVLRLPKLSDPFQMHRLGSWGNLDSNKYQGLSQ